MSFLPEMDFLEMALAKFGSAAGHLFFQDWTFVLRSNLPMSSFTKVQKNKIGLCDLPLSTKTYLFTRVIAYKR